MKTDKFVEVTLTLAAELWKLDEEQRLLEEQVDIGWTEEMSDRWAKLERQRTALRQKIYDRVIGWYKAGYVFSEIRSQKRAEAAKLVKARFWSQA